MINTDERLTRGERLSSSAEIKRIRVRGERFSAGKIRLFRLANKTRNPRLAVALTVKAGKNVLRNRVRRIIREFFRQNKKTLGGFDYFFYSNQNLTSLTKSDWDIYFKSILKWCRKSKVPS